MKLAILKTVVSLSIITTVFLSTIIVAKPVYAINTVFAAPVTIDTILGAGSAFYINLTIADVENLWGFQFAIWYNTTVLTATGYESYAPFTLSMPLDIDDTLGYIATASTMLYGEPVGFSTLDPAPIARVEFVVDSEGISALHFDRNFTVLSDVFGVPVPFEMEDGSFSSIALPAHDIAVTEVTAFPTTVTIGQAVVIEVRVLNEGTETETFDITVKYDDNDIETKTVIQLASGRSETVGFTWITTEVGPGSYVISADAGIVDGEDNAANNQRIDGTVTVTRPLLPPVALMTWLPQTPYAGEEVTFDASSSYDPDGTIQSYHWYFGDGTPYIESVEPITTHVFAGAGIYNVHLEVVDNDGLYSSTTSIIVVLSGMTIKLASPVDYFWKERVKIRLSALVTDAQSMKPVSDATVTVQIYDPDGNLWVSEAMVERITGTGIYEWESSDTVEKLELQKGVYLVHAQASRGGSPKTSDILEFHIDPPSEGSLGGPASYFILATVALATVAVGSGFLLKRKHSKNKDSPQLTHTAASL